MDRWRWPFVLMGVMGLLGVAHAQGTPQASSQAPAQQKPAPADTSKPPASPDATAKPVVPAPAKVTPSTMNAVVLDAAALDSIIGRSVKSPTGEDMGRIVDMLAPPNGQVRAAVIDFGGFLGVGSRKIAVDWKALNFNELGKSGNVIVELRRDQVHMAPEYKQGDPIVLLEATSPDEAKAQTKPVAVPPAPAAPKPPGAAASQTK